VNGMNRLRSFPKVIDRTREEDLLRLALLKERAAYRAFWKEHGGEKVLKARECIANFFYAAGNNHGDGSGWHFDVSKCEPEFDIITRFKSGLYAKFSVNYLEGPTTPFEESFEALDPFNNKTPTRVPFSFDDPPTIVEVFLDEQGQPPPLGENGYMPLELPLQPSERLLKVDLSRKRSELLAEFTRFLDAVDCHRQPGVDLPLRFRENYEQWGQDRTRFVKEAWTHLEVWRLRRQRHPFLEICRITGIKIDAAKKSFARAYELIEGHRYDHNRYRDLYREIVAPELRKTCSTCPERNTTCTDLCPDVLAFLDQGEGKQKDLLTATGTAEPLPRKDIYEANQEVQDEIDRRLTPAGK